MKRKTIRFSVLEENEHVRLFDRSEDHFRSRVFVGEKTFFRDPHCIEICHVSVPFGRPEERVSFLSRMHMSVINFVRK